jgi:hypothetical protein
MIVPSDTTSDGIQQCRGISSPDISSSTSSVDVKEIIAIILGTILFLVLSVLFAKNNCSFCWEYLLLYSAPIINYILGEFSNAVSRRLKISVTGLLDRNSTCTFKESSRRRNWFNKQKNQTKKPFSLILAASVWKGSLT